MHGLLRRPGNIGTYGSHGIVVSASGRFERALAGLSPILSESYKLNKTSSLYASFMTYVRILYATRSRVGRTRFPEGQEVRHSRATNCACQCRFIKWGDVAHEPGGSGLAR